MAKQPIKSAAKKKPTSKKVVVALSVDIEVLSPDQLKKFVFGIEKTRDGALEKWTVNFNLFVRDKKSANFVQQIKVDVAISLQNVPVAEQTALKDMTVRQKNFVNTVVSAAADRFKAGEITKEEFQAIIDRTFRKR